MKIKINSDETYEIKLPNETEISIQEASMFASRLLKIVKAIGKDEIMEGIIETKQKRSYNLIGNNNSKIWTKDRNETIKLLKLHYHASLDEKRAYAREYNIDWATLSNKFSALKKKWNIQPQEVGLKNWYKRGEYQPLRMEKTQNYPTAFFENSIKHNKRNPYPFSKNRELALQVIHTHFWGTNEQKQAIANQFKVEWEKIAGLITILRRKFDIKPQEVELKEFPNKQTCWGFKNNKDKWKMEKIENGN
jgi:hypothetical protein